MKNYHNSFSAFSWDNVAQDVLGDGISNIVLTDSLGSDLSVVNDAKASYAKRESMLTDKGCKLIEYLVNNQHTSPLRGVVLKFSVKAPLFVCRQYWKHVVAVSSVEDQLQHNEQSGRYTVLEDQFYSPSVWRSQSESNKQGSGEDLDEDGQKIASSVFEECIRHSYATYRRLLSLGVTKEQARLALPVNVYVSWVSTMSLHAALHFCTLRLDSHAQWEIQQYAKYIAQACERVAPHVTRAWMAKHVPHVKSASAIEAKAKIWDKIQTHVFKRVVVANGAGRIVCSCGWQSSVEQDADMFLDPKPIDIEKEVETHLDEVRKRIDGQIF